MANSEHIPADVKNKAVDELWKAINSRSKVGTDADAAIHRLSNHYRFQEAVALHIIKLLDDDDFWYEGE